MRKTLLTTLFLLCILGMARAWTNVGLRTTESPNSLTVFPEATSTSNYVPAYIFYWDDFTKSQFVIPASELTYMTGGTITSMKFYTSPNNVPYTSVSTADFYLKEVASETISAYVDKADATVVYSGTIDVVSAGDGGEVTITFDTPFTYNGGNLLIGCENTTDAGYKNIYFIGETGHTGAAIAGSNGTSLDDVPATDRGFLPKTTFTYTGGTAVPDPVTPTNVAVSEITENSAKVTWDGTNESFTLRYRSVPSDAVFFDHFEDGLDKWVTIDADGDGNTWVHSSAPGIYHNSGVDLSGSGHEGTDGFALSGSYANQTGLALTPDNYLVTADKVALGGTITFYVCAQDASYAAEHFGVAVSTAGNTDATDFTMLNEWTLSAAPSMKMVPGRSSNVPMRQGSWYQYSVDLSAYAGQEGYVAIRHFNCTDQFILNLDDVVITAPAATAPTMAKRKHVISMLRGSLSWQTVSTTNNYAELTGLDANTTYEVQVQGTAAGMTSEWSPIVQFTTLEGTAPVIVNAPTDLTVADITATSATVSWNGDADGYEMELGVAGSAEVPAVYDFSDGTLQGWTNLVVNTDGGQWIHSNDNPGAYDYSAQMSDGQFAMCYSYIDYDGPYDTDAYLVSPQAFDIVAGSQLTFKASNANSAYPESITVCVAETTGTPTAADFTVVTTPTVSTGWDAFSEISVDLSAYAGKSIWIAFHDQNYDAYEIWIDDIAISGAKKHGFRNAKKRDITWTSIGDVTSPYDLTGLEPETEYSVRVRGVSGSSTSDWVTTTFTTLAAGPVVPAPTGLTISDITYNSAVATWTGSNDSYTLRYRPVESVVPGEGNWYSYDEGASNEDAIGTGGGQFYWGIMLPAGSYTGEEVLKVSAYDYMAMTGNVTIYNDGDTAPANVVGTMDVEFTGAEDWAEFTFDTPVAIDNTKNVWVVFYNESGATYPAAVCANTGDANGRWVSLDGSTWDDLVNYGLDYSFMVKAYIGTAPTAPNMAKRKHVISMLRGEAEWTTLDVAEATAELTDLDPETTYEVQVQGITGGETSEWSDVVTFTTLAAPAVEAPTDLAISEITAESAVATWSGTNDSYNIRFREVTAPSTDAVTVTLTTDDVWGDGTGYQMLLDADATAFGSIIPETGALALGDVDASVYAEFEYKIPENADGSLTTTNIILDSSASIEIPAGTYDWCITNPTPGDRMWIASGNGNVGGRADDYEFEAGKTYEFHVYMGGTNDATDVTITESTRGAAEWTTAEGVASPYSLTGLTAETEYEVQVQGVTGGVASDWSASVLFTTTEATGINGLKVAGQENWYTIDGRKLAKRPTTAGVYILNGHKVMVK